MITRSACSIFYFLALEEKKISDVTYNPSFQRWVAPWDGLKRFLSCRTLQCWVLNTRNFSTILNRVPYHSCNKDNPLKPNQICRCIWDSREILVIRIIKGFLEILQGWRWVYFTVDMCNNVGVYFRKVDKCHIYFVLLECMLGFAQGRGHERHDKISHGRKVKYVLPKFKWKYFPFLDFYTFYQCFLVFQVGEGMPIADVHGKTIAVDLTKIGRFSDGPIFSAFSPMFFYPSYP